MKFVVLLSLLIFCIINAQEHWIVGTASNTVLPPINGKVDYVGLKKKINSPIVDFPETDFDTPGVFTPKFDTGPVYVANGGGFAYWVRDHINCTVVTMRTSDKQTLITVSVNVYMIFKNDWELYETMVKKKAGKRYGDLKFVGHATHNHHGPDSAGINPIFLLNKKYFEYMLNVMVKTTMEALAREEPAILQLSKSRWGFGMADNRDPRILDKDLRVLQAISIKNRNIITIIAQWSNHPEVTLGFSPKVDPKHCEALGKPNCNANGKYFTGDFVGVAERYLKKKYGSTLCYINGPIGVLIAPLRAKVWEVSERFPIIGDGSRFPPGATEIPKNFRKQFVIGRELAIQIERTMRVSPTILRPVEFKYKVQEFFTRNANVKFRLIMAIVSPATNRSMAGYQPRDCYICSDPKNPTIETCKSDGYTNTISAEFPLPLRKGEFVKTKTILVDFGPLKWITGPAEVPPELFLGLPEDFGIKYYENPQNHAVGENYTMPGYVLQHLKCQQQCWFVGLGQDELGYMVPISDVRIKCNFHASECKRLGITYHDSMSGVECKWIIENPEEAKKKYEKRYDGVSFICKYGHIAQAQNHYEETNSLGWDMAKDYIDSVVKIVKD